MIKLTSYNIYWMYTSIYKSYRTRVIKQNSARVTIILQINLHELPISKNNLLRYNANIPTCLICFFT